MPNIALFFLLAALLSFAIKYGLPWLHPQPSPSLLALLVIGPTFGMALWLITGTAFPPKKG